MPPESWWRPSPKTRAFPATAGELTEASLRYGADRDHAGCAGPFAPMGYTATVGRLNAPMPARKTRSPTGTGLATKWSCPLTAHSTAGLSGPGWLSVQPVRCGLPRYVAHGPGSAATAGEASNARSVAVRIRMMGSGRFESQPHPNPSPKKGGAPAVG